MRRFVLGLFALIGLVTVLAFIGVGVAVWAVSHPRSHGAYPAEPPPAADALQRPLRFRFQARLRRSVRRRRRGRKNQRSQ